MNPSPRFHSRCAGGVDAAQRGIAQIEHVGGAAGVHVQGAAGVHRDLAGAAGVDVRIPYGETRKYVQRVLAYAAIYEWRMQLPVTPLSRRMPDVRDADAYRHPAG